MKPIDCLIEARWIVPVEPAGALEAHALAVHDGRIEALLPALEARRLFSPARHVRLENHALIPGLVNLHTHAAMTLLRGLADDVALMRALGQLDPAQREALLLKYAEGLEYSEMSALTGAGESALKMRVKRGSERLRTLLGRTFEDSPFGSTPTSGEPST